MRKAQKILAGFFLCGVLIGGVGMGIALAEYSSLAYGGEKLIGEDSIVIKALDFNFEPDGRALEVMGFHYLGRGQIREIEIDDSVPVGTVRFEVTYNEKTVTPGLEFEAYEEETQEEEKKAEKLGYLRLTASYHSDDFALLMENKDRMLEELKQGKISSYDVAYITDVKIKINSKTAPYIESCYAIR